jgi:hypothetical protein
MHAGQLSLEEGLASAGTGRESLNHPRFIVSTTYGNISHCAISQFSRVD